jgi:hypothetical protein
MMFCRFLVFDHGGSPALRSLITATKHSSYSGHRTKRTVLYFYYYLHSVARFRSTSESIFGAITAGHAFSLRARMNVKMILKFTASEFLIPHERVKHTHVFSM